MKRSLTPLSTPLTAHESDLQGPDQLPLPGLQLGTVDQNLIDHHNELIPNAPNRTSPGEKVHFTKWKNQMKKRRYQRKISKTRYPPTLDRAPKESTSQAKGRTATRKTLTRQMTLHPLTGMTTSDTLLHQTLIGRVIFPR
jgi:hypothetical protein